ncbi:hypothetical protein HYH02_009488 [Chlamydomonas schloesseri]|uniref:HIT domain-containing protein n=1 Tax=Chlamydomonas schloesseri TaxID=2026947 RepID=A0A835TLY8_9CHLO|nr:hypothetical protein HYH02_009488 [Chlamydomonas schloesseri]|eukprot:KAG2443074.1 hypothetical protein HYH02_009488 [Chlamydomonas schloesseri]
MGSGLCDSCFPRRAKAGRYRDEPVPDCPFCGIVAGKNPERVIFRTERLVAFPNIRPEAATHLLVVPAAHVRNTDVLGTDDLEMVEEMDRVGRELLAKTAPAGSELKLGYHVPPWRSIDHLHLHCMALPHSPPWAAIKYMLPGVWLSSADLAARLRRRRQRPSGLLQQEGGGGGGIGAEGGAAV